MKKDYMPVMGENENLSETDFIDQHWTQIWENSAPNTYAAGMVERQERFKIMQPFISALPSNGHILDGGCGLGEWVLYFTSKGFQTIGLDLSQVTISKLKGKFPDYNFQTGDIRKTSFEDNYFDLYFSWGTFEHFENGFHEPLAEARRILKAGGYLMITVPFYNGRHILRDQRPLHLWEDGYEKDMGYSSKMRFYQWRLNRAELQREFEINGFKTLKVQPVDKTHGLYRAVKHDLKINPDSRLGKIAQSAWAPFVSSNYVSHMLMGVAQKI